MNNPMDNSSIGAGFDRNRRDVIFGGALAALGLGILGIFPAESPLRACQPYGPTTQEAMP